MGSRRQIRTCTTGTNQVSSSKYDQAGNISGLPPGYGFSYDAENRITAESNAGGLSASYYYDGVGDRVEKVLSNGQATVYVYDVFGRLAEEYSPANSWSKDYVPFNGQTVAIENASASPCATCYLNYDNLGTVRMVTDGSASVITRHDYLPFGDEIPAGSAGRNSQFGPYVDNVDQKFTGQVRDAETANDFFNARYYTAPLMRFLSPDPGNMGADPTDPQTWNAYGYVRNNPLALVDPSGMCDVTEGDTTGLSPDTPLGCGDDGGSSTVSSGGTTLVPSNPPSNVTLDPGCCTLSFTPPTSIKDGRNPNPGFALFPAIFGNGWVGVGSGSTPTYSANSTSHQDVSTVSTPPKNQLPLPPQIQACDSAILNAVNTKFKTSFTDTNVTRRFQFSKGAVDGQGTLNLNISVPAAMQPTKVAVGRYPVNPATYVLGAGATLHIPPGPGGADSRLTLPFNASQFTAHLDSALPYNPIGLLSHLLQDMSSLGGYKPCP